MTTLDEREQRTLSKRCTRCYETKPLTEFSPHKGMRDGRDPRCRACNAKRDRERRWAQKGIPKSEWPRLHKEADHKAETRVARHNSAPDGFKVCSRCDEAKPLEDFPPEKRGRCGRHSQCHACHAKRKRERQWQKQGIPESDWPRLHARHALNENMRHLNAIFGGKWCPGCEQHLPREYFHRNIARADGRDVVCRVCKAAREAAYRRTEAGRASAKGSDQRRRARERNLPTDGTGPRDWAAWAEEQDDFLCNLCGGMLTAEDEIHYDHVDPISTGTTGTVLHNMRAVHAWCNLSRGNRPIDEWRAAMGLTEEIP